MPVTGVVEWQCFQRRRGVDGLEVVGAGQFVDVRLELVPGDVRELNRDRNVLRGGVGRCEGMILLPVKPPFHC